MATVEGSHIGTSGGSSVGALLYYGTISIGATEYTVPIKAGGKLTKNNWTSASIVYKMGGEPNTSGTASWTKTDSSTHSEGSSWYTLSQQTVHFNRTHSDYTATIYASITTNGHTSTAKKTFTVSKRASYTVSYNANGGSGAPSTQTKWYGEDLTLSATVPTRAKYKFKGWATSATGDVAVQPSGTYTGNAAITYYAVWELLGDVKMGSYSAFRCDSSGNADDEGTSGKFTCTYILSGQGLNEGSITARYRASNASTWTDIADITHGNHIKAEGKASLSVDVSCLISNLSQDKSYVIELTVTDSYGNTAIASDYISQAYFTMDFLAGGKGIGIGTTASCDESKHPNGLLTCAMDALFKGKVSFEKHPTVAFGHYNAIITGYLKDSRTYHRANHFSGCSYSHAIRGDDVFAIDPNGFKVLKSGFYLLMLHSHYNTSAANIQMATQFFNYTKDSNVASTMYSVNAIGWGMLANHAIVHLDADDKIIPEWQKYSTDTTTQWKPTAIQYDIVLLSED